MSNQTLTYSFLQTDDSDQLPAPVESKSDRHRADDPNRASDRTSQRQRESSQSQEKTQSTHPIQRLLELREFLSSLPPDEPYFRIRKSPLDGLRANPEPFLMLVGSWQIPAEFVDTKAPVAVNPAYDDRAIYSDVFVKSDCGCVFSGPRHQHPTNSAQDESCNPIEHSGGRKQWWEQRRTIAVKSLYLQRPLQYLAARMAVSKDNVDDIIHKKLDICPGDLRNRGDRGLKVVLNRIWPHFTNADLQKALGMSQSRLNRLHNEPLDVP